MVTFSSTAEDPLEQGACIVLTHLELVPLNIGYFWSAFDDSLELLQRFSGINDIDLEDDNSKLSNNHGASIRFTFQDALVSSRLLCNEKENYIWRTFLPKETPLLESCTVSLTAKKITEMLTEISIKIEISLQSNDREKRKQNLNSIVSYIPSLISEIIFYLENRDGSKFIISTLCRQ